MVPDDFREAGLDPAEMLDGVLERAWQTVATAFDLRRPLPELQCLFQGIEFSHPDRAAETLLINMLQEVMESTGRFSPWYRMPARAYGLISVRDRTTGTSRWMLAPEAGMKWREVLETLAAAIQKNSGLIQAMILVDGLMLKASLEDPGVFASCACSPTRTVRIKQSVLQSAEIVCDACQLPFKAVEDFQHWILEDLKRERRNRMMVNLKKPLTIRQLLEINRETAPVCVRANATVFDALRLMAEKNAGAVTVVDADGQMVGIFSERDYARKIILMGRSSLDTFVTEIMTRDPVTTCPETTLEEGLAIMTAKAIRHLPVLEGGRLVGLVSMSAIMEALMDQKDSAIEVLEKYILGREK